MHNLWTAVIAARVTGSTSQHMDGSLSSCGMGPDPGERLSWPAADRLEPGSGLGDLPTEEASLATVPATDGAEVGGVGIFTTCPWRARTLTVPRRVPSVTGHLPDRTSATSSHTVWVLAVADPLGHPPRRRRDGRVARPPVFTDSFGHGEAARCGVAQAWAGGRPPPEWVAALQVDQQVLTLALEGASDPRRSQPRLPFRAHFSYLALHIVSFHSIQ